VIVLTYQWARVVWSRTIVQLAAEEERRRAAAQQQSMTLLDSLGKTGRPDDPDGTGDPDTVRGVPKPPDPQQDDR